VDHLHGLVLSAGRRERPAVADGGMARERGRLVLSRDDEAYDRVRLSNEAGRDSYTAGRDVKITNVFLQGRKRAIVFLVITVIVLLVIAVALLAVKTLNHGAGKPPATPLPSRASQLPSATAPSSSRAPETASPPASSGPGPDGRFVVTMNLTGLSFNAADIDNAPVTNGINPSKQAFRVPLSQGSHVLQLPAYPGPWTAFPFQVTSKGTVSYDTSQDGGVLTGAGTSTLGAISTATVTVDVTATSYTSVAISGCGWYPGADRQQCRLVPGNYSLDLQTYPLPEEIPFRITPAGAISYDGTAASVLTGSGTSTLGVAAKTITVDATASSSGKFELNAAIGWRAAGTPWQYKLAPGTYALVLPTPVTNQYAKVLFTITSTGTVSYDTSQHPGWLTGAGTTTLHLMH
jgi:hypothetical protein